MEYATGWEGREVSMKSISMLLARSSLYLVLVTMIAVGGGASLITRLSALVAWLVLLLLVAFTRRPGTIGIAVCAFSLAVFCGAWTYLQTSEAAWSILSQSALAQTVISSAIPRATLSIAPADSIQTLVTVLFPVAMFLAVFFAFTDEKKTTNFIRLNSMFGALVALYGIMIYALGNDWLLFSAKRFYLQNLTAVFVNRNTTANYFGIALNGLTALICAGVQQRQPMDKFKKLPNFADVTLGLYAVGWLVVFLALMLTGSRAGTVTSILSVLVIASLCLLGSTSSKRRLSWSRVLSILAIALSVLLLTYLLASPIFSRINSDWTYDPRFCIMPGLVRLWSDNWFFGTGLGTFPLAFPPYKDPSCGLPELWLQAHNFYIEGAITFGLPFLVLVPLTVTILAIIFVQGLRHRRRYKWTAALGIGLLLQQLIHNAIDFPIQNAAIAIVFASLMAVCVLVSLRRPELEVGRQLAGTEKIRPQN